MNSVTKRIKTQMFWQQRRNIVRFERHETDCKTLVLGETEA